MLHILWTLIIFPVEQIIEFCFAAVFRIFRSEGLSILGVSVAVSTLVLPIYLMADKQQRAEREKQNKMRGEADNIKAVFKGDKRHMLISTLYRQNNYHPLYSLRGSLDLFIQIPFFIAAYHFLHNLELLKGKSFFFIQDLGAPDALLFGINLLPILMTLINCISGTIYTKGFPLKDKLQLYGMAAIFLILLYNSPAGLVLYWTSNNVYNLIKNILQKTKHAGKIIYGAVVAISLMLIIFLLFFSKKNLSKVLVVSAAAFAVICLPLWKKAISFIYASIKKSKAFGGLSIQADIKTFALSCLALFLLVGLVIPSALISSSVEEFSFIGGYVNPFSFIQNVLLQSAGLFLVWGFFIYVISDKKIRRALSVFMAVFTILSVINTFVFKGNYGVITQTLEFPNLKNWGANLIIISAIVNAALAIFIIALFTRKFIINALLTLTLISCMAFGIINVIQIRVRDNNADKTQMQRVIEPETEYTFSKNGKNVLVIMLDRAFSGYVSAILEERPELKDDFSGFVFYPNTISFMGHTIMGAPPIYGGYEYTPLEMNRRNKEPLIQKHNEALLLLPKLFSDNNFSVSVTDPPLANYHWLGDVNIFEEYPDIHASKILYTQKYVGWWKKTHSMEHLLEKDAADVLWFLNNDLIRFSFFRIALPLFREILYGQGTYCEIRIEIGAHNALEAYAMLDVLPEITGVTAENINTYNSVYNDLTHDSAYFEFPDYDASKKITNLGSGVFSTEGAYHTNIASWILLSKWFNFLKENGVYDNTRIIVAADHGMGHGSIYNETLPNGAGLAMYAPLLMVKDFSAEGALRFDNAFMTNADVPLLLLDGLVDNPVNPFTGKSLTYDKKDGVTITTSHQFEPTRNGNVRFPIKNNEWLHVKDNIFDMSNWQRVQPE